MSVQLAALPVLEVAEQDPRQRLLWNELDRRLSGFEFEDGALLIEIPQVPLHLIEPEVARNRGYFSYPPQGLLYLSATLRRLGVATHIVDLNFEVLAEAQKDVPDVESAWRVALDRALGKFGSPFVCVSFMFEPTYPEFERVCEYVRKAKPGACIAAGGVNATADPGRLLSQGLVDLVFSHEGEHTLDRFYDYVRRRPPATPPNVSFLGSHGDVLQTDRQTGSDVSADIREEYAGIAIRDYNRVGSLSNFSRMNGIEVPFATLLSRRGCRAHCSFCGVRNFNGLSVRVREVEHVLIEMEHLYREHGIRHFDWLDDDLLFDRQAALELFHGIADRLPGITWAANNGLIASAITPEIMQAMQASGCIGFKVGLESGNAEVLRRIHKPTRLDKFFGFAEMAQDYPHMFVAVNFIMGFPGERFCQMQDSFRTAVQARLDWNNFYMYQHIKNTELFIAYSGLSDNYVVLEHGKEAQGPNLNPVRGGAFKDYRLEDDLVTGYDVLHLPADLQPSKAQLKEVWFTFNYVANFLRMPALATDSEVRLRNGLRWMEVLSQAYPEDAAMSSVVYYLRWRLGGSSLELEESRQAARRKFDRSHYWTFRDGQFHFSALLDNTVPPSGPLEA
jgi:radical SAM superfamily enzyme YgiQ (UPF0313 family)